MNSIDRLVKGPGAIVCFTAFRPVYDVPILALPHLTAPALINIQHPAKSLPFLVDKYDLVFVLALWCDCGASLKDHLIKDEHQEHPATPGHCHSKVISICTVLASIPPADFPSSKESCSSARGTNIP